MNPLGEQSRVCSSRYDKLDLFPHRKNASMKDNMDVSKEIILGLFHCSQKLLADLQKQAGPVVVKRPGKCIASKVRVIKTIGTRKSRILPWIVNKDIKARLLLMFLFSCILS